MAYETKFTKKEQKAYKKLLKHSEEEDKKYHDAYMKASMKGRKKYGWS